MTGVHRHTTERRAWRDVTAIIAVLSLVAALSFNTIQVRDSARSIKANEDALALQHLNVDFQTFTWISSTLQRSHAQLEPSPLQARRASSLVDALRPKRALALALKAHLVQSPYAESLWANLLYCNSQLAQTSTRRGGLPPHFPQVVIYARAYQAAHPQTRCL